MATSGLNPIQVRTDLLGPPRIAGGVNDSLNSLVQKIMELRNQAASSRSEFRKSLAEESTRLAEREVSLIDRKKNTESILNISKIIIARFEHIKPFILIVTQKSVSGRVQSPGVEIIDNGASINSIRTPLSMTQPRELSIPPKNRFLSHDQYNPFIVVALTILAFFVGYHFKIASKKIILQPMPTKIDMGIVFLILLYLAQEVYLLMRDDHQSKIDKKFEQWTDEGQSILKNYEDIKIIFNKYKSELATCQESIEADVDPDLEELENTCKSFYEKYGPLTIQHENWLHQYSDFRSMKKRNAVSPNLFTLPLAVILSYRVFTFIKYPKRNSA